MSRTSLNAFNISASTASAPAVIQGLADASTYPGVALGVLANSGARQDNGTALQAFLDWCIANGRIAYFGMAVLYTFGLLSAVTTMTSQIL